MVEKTKTIRVAKDTKERLDKFGKFGESYEDILIRLLDRWNEKHKAKPIKSKKRHRIIKIKSKKQQTKEVKK